MILLRRLASMAALGVSLAACGKATPSRAPVAVEVAPVTEARFTDDIDTVSTLEAKELVQLAAQASGRILELKISQGDAVAPGQLLVVLDQTQIRAELANLQAQAQKDKLNWERYEFLVPQGAASAKERDEFKAQYVASREAVIAKEADLSYSNLRSPVRGIVADVQVKVGDVIRSGDPFTQLIKNNQLEARVEVPSTYSDRIQLGLPVVLSMPGSNKVLAQSTVTSVDPTIAAGTQALLVKAVFPNPDGVLRNGQRLRTRVQLDARQLPSVPFAAVTQSSGQSFVYRVGSFKQLEAQPGKADLSRIRKGIEMGKIPAGTRFALQTPVTLGSLQNNRYPVVKGLALGDKVITTNLLSLRHGMPIQVKN
ncbi:multidrug efflux pump membrane fusion protein [Synechococcus sp. WH 8101]|nr:multidrug efflux pump membrane fusion protein [Synechococcus sp. WH 8101]